MANQMAPKRRVTFVDSYDAPTQDRTHKHNAEFKVSFSLERASRSHIKATPRDNKINRRELRAVMRSFGYNPTRVELEDLIRDIEEDGDGTFDFAVFKVIDRDGNGFLSANELRQAMGILGEDLTDEEVDEMIREADLDGDGKINYREFSRMMANEPQSQSQDVKVIDRDGNGFICADELRQAIGNLGIDLSDEEIDELIREADLDGDGQMNYEEFVRMMAKDWQSQYVKL